MKQRRGPAHIRRWVRATPPVVTDDAANGYRVGDVIVDSAAGVEWLCVDNTTSAAEWMQSPALSNRYVRPQMMNPKNVLFVSNFDGGIGVEWVKITGTAMEDESTTYKVGSKSIKFTSVNNDNLLMDKTAALDVSAHEYLKFRVYIDDISKVSVLQIWFGEAAWAKYFTYDFAVSSGYRSGWNDLLVHKSQFTDTGGANWALIAKQRVQARSSLGNTVIVIADEMCWYDRVQTRAKVVISFDDGYVRVFDEARRIMDRYHFPGVAYVTPGNLPDANLMTAEQMSQLQDIHRWEIGYHSWAHENLTAMTSPQRRADVLRSLNWFERNGIGPIVTGAYPFGATDDAVISDMRHYFPVMRGTRQGLKNIHLPLLANSYELPIGSVLYTTSLATVQGWVDTAVTNTSLLILLLHDLVAATPGANEWLISDFQSLIDYIATQDIDVVTMAQALELTA